MAALLSARLRRWVLVAVVVPLSGYAARRLATTIERRRGPNTLSRGLNRVGSLAGAPNGRSGSDTYR
jgi:hypothetical protein